MEKEIEKIMSLQISVRLARPEDAEQMHHVHINSVRQLCAVDYTKEQIEAWVGHLNSETRHQYMVNGARDEVIFVAEDENSTIIGFSAFDIYGDISAVYVHPDYTRQGVGKQLLQVAENEALAHNFKKLQISASITALPFYKAQGYKFIKYSLHRLRSNVKIPCALLEKSLVTDITND